MSRNANSSLPPWIEAMLDPAFYPHDCESIQLRQTHISFVILTGSFAYKLKKAVTFDFLDYGALEKRRFYCLEELRLNKRFSSELYIDVFPVRKVDENRYELGEGAGEVVDYVLKMHQFDEHQILSNMLQEGRLTRSHVEMLGKTVAHFHESLQGSEALSEYGRIERVSQVIEENFLETRKYIGRGQTRLQFEETKQFSREFLDNHADWFFHRRFGQHIRECHGDLHLGNVFYDQGQIHLFDSIEFNPSFTNIDTMYDIAFTIVDLEFRGRRDWAYVFLNQYLEQTGDFGGAVLLPLYCSIRAYVLAKVASFLMDDQMIASADKDDAAERAQGLYRLSWSYSLARPRRLYALSGLSGSGKSRIGRLLAEQLGLVQIRSDVVRKHLANVSLEEKGNESLYRAEVTQETYQHVSEMGLFLSENGVPALLDARFSQRSWRMMLRESARERGIDLLFIYCRVPEPLLRTRLAAREKDVSDADSEVLERQIAEWEDFIEEERDDLLILENEEEWSDQVEERLLKTVTRQPWDPKRGSSMSRA